MDVGSPIRQPAQGPLPGQFQTAPSKGPVVTELPKPLVVEAVDTPQGVKVDINPNFAHTARLAIEVDQRRKQFVIDEKTKDLIVRTLDVTSGEIVAQYPDEWQVKQRAYSRAMIEKQFASQFEVDKAGSFDEKVAKVA
jgi:hypothetical protein